MIEHYIKNRYKERRVLYIINIVAFILFGCLFAVIPEVQEDNFLWFIGMCAVMFPIHLGSFLYYIFTSPLSETIV